MTMKKAILFDTLIFLTILSYSQNRKFYVGTFTSEGAEGIYLCNFNTKTGDISLENTFKAIDDPSFLKISPNRQYLYVVTRGKDKIEKSGGYVASYKINKNGTIHFLNKQVSNGKDPCHVDVSRDGKFVAISSYGSGTNSLFPVNDDGSLQPASSVIENQGSGPDKTRQSAPHAHSMKFSPFNNQVYSADLGTDQFNIFYLEGEQLVKKGQEYVKLAPGAGPRHFDFYPNEEVIYVISELNSTITALKQVENSWKKFQVVSTLPAGFKGNSFCADIHVSDDGKFLYGSNRGHNSIAVYSINQDSKELKFIDTVSTEGDWPRNFALSPDGKFMLVANQRSGNITVFKINPENGLPKFITKEISLPSPVCIEFL